MNLQPITGWLSRLTARVKTLEAATTAAALAPTAVNVTADRAITATEAYGGIVVSNIGASGAVVLALPAGLPGMSVTAINIVTQSLSLNPVDTEIIYPIGGTPLTEDVPILSNAAGEHITLVCVEAGKWVTANCVGTWSANGS